MVPLFLTTFIVSIFALQWWQQPAYPSALLCILCITCILKKTRPIAMAIIFALISVSRTTFIPPNIHEQQTTFIGTIVEEPDRRPLQTKYTIEVDGERILVQDKNQWPRYNYGDRITVTGRPEHPGIIHDFNYANYLSISNIYTVIYQGNIELLSKRHTQFYKSFLFNLKYHFESQLNTLLPEPHASFMAGLLTGSRRGIPQEILNTFNTTGLTHIIAISGYNITMIIVVISSLLFWLPFRWRLLPSVISIIAFTIFVGASAAVVRAAIMGVLGLLALHTGNRQNTRISIGWTLCFMLIVNPKYLWYDAGFQLSFLAVIGLNECSPYLNKLCARLPKTLGIQEAMQMTLAAQITAAPWIALLFDRISLVAPLANMLAAPAIPLAMLFGFLGTAISLIHFPIGQIIAYGGWACLEWILHSAALLSSLPYASIDLHITIPMIIGYYGCIVVFLVQQHLCNSHSHNGNA